MQVCKLQESTKRDGYKFHSITIPERYMKELGWQKGDLIRFMVKGSELILVCIASE